ncbi:MAG: hypothetical protein V3U65_18830 [Granulosicoccaceae bacterium]
MPFRKPSELAERPSWLLGLWTAVAVTLGLTIALNMAYQMNLYEVRQMLKPSGFLLAGILAPGLIAYFIYARSVRLEIAAQSLTEASSAAIAEDSEYVGFNNVDGRDTEPEKIFDDIDNYEAITDEDIELPVTAANNILVDEFAKKVNTNEAIFDNHENSIIVDRAVDDVELVTGIEHMSWTEAPATQTAESDTWVTGIEHMLWNDDEPAVVVANPVPIFKETEVAEQWVTGIEHMTWPKASEAEVEAEVEVEVEASVPALTINTDNAPNPELELAAEVEIMRRSLSDEVALREETEKHLRITRRGLSALESEQKHIELQKADAVIEIEEKLEAQIKRTSISEARAGRMEKQKTALETQMLKLKTSVVEAKREIRQSTAARAKALSTANKSVAFAQQAIKERGIFEAQLKDAELALNKRQKTIGSLISALEKEKLRTQSEISSMAKQFVLHEKQLQARRSIEQVSRKVEGTLGTRLVKKIATGANRTVV